MAIDVDASERQLTVSPVTGRDEAPAHRGSGLRAAVATVPGEASVSASENRSVVLVFVDQTITVAGGAPSNTASTVKVSLDKIGDQWLVSGIRSGVMSVIGKAASSMSVAGVLTVAALAAPIAHADNKRLNDGVVANVYTVQHQAGCTNDVKIDPQLRLAAQWHAVDVLNNRNLDGDVGSDGSTPQNRSAAAGFDGQVAETVAINPGLAINGVEILNQWYYRPDYREIMQDCTYTAIGVWSENSLDRSVVVAVYGRPPT